MKVSISNIGWSEENDLKVYKKMEEMGFKGLEIAPTRIFPEKPYDKLDEAKKWAKKIETTYGFEIPSIQSIWYGRNEKLFGIEEDRIALVDYTKKAIDFAEALGCRNLVFWCPRNRNMPEGTDENIAIEFFKTIGDYAAEHDTVIGMEANPPMYNTNFINNTRAALDLIEKVCSTGFKLNLDLGTMIENGEDLSMLNGRECLINHVHISEPGLKPIKRRNIYEELHEMLTNRGYDGFVSIEVGKQESMEKLVEMMKYVRELFGG